MREYYAEIREKNYRNVVKKNPLIDYYSTSIYDEPKSIGIEWHGGIDTPSRLVGRPNQPYWSLFYLIFMFGHKRFIFKIRGKKMPYRNYDEYFIWHKKRQKLFRLSL